MRLAFASAVPMIRTLGKRVVAFRFPIRSFQLLKVAWLFTVVEDDLLVEFAKVGHQPNISMALWIAPTSASISSFVL